MAIWFKKIKLVNEQSYTNRSRFVVAFATIAVQDGMDIKAGRLQPGDLLDMRKMYMYDRSWESSVNAIWFGKTSWRGFYFFFHSRTLGCETGIPFLITYKSITASSRKELCPAHRNHGVFGEDRFWCSEEEKTSYIEIRFPMRYKIIGARIQLLRKYKIKDIILKIQLFDQWINIHYVKVSSLMRQVISTTQCCFYGNCRNSRAVIA